MTDKEELDSLKADLASLREEITGFAAGLKRSAAIHEEQAHEAAPQDRIKGEDVHGLWTELLHKFDSSRIQGEKVVKDLAAEVEQNPLVSIVAAFGLGYLIAKLWYRGKANENTDDAS